MNALLIKLDISCKGKSDENVHLLRVESWGWVMYTFSHSWGWVSKRLSRKSGLRQFKSLGPLPPPLLLDHSLNTNKSFKTCTVGLQACGLALRGETNGIYYFIEKRKFALTFARYMTSRVAQFVIKIAKLAHYMRRRGMLSFGVRPRLLVTYVRVPPIPMPLLIPSNMQFDREIWFDSSAVSKV